MPTTATDTQPTTRAGGGAPAENAAAISLDDANELTYVTRAILASAVCTVKVTMKGGQTVTLPLQAGYNPLRVKKVFNIGTTLSGATLYALW